MNKFITTAILSVALIPFSASARAETLYIHNFSSVGFSFMVDHQCSAEFGTVESLMLKAISENELRNACGSLPDHCMIKIYNKPNCGGVHEATVKLSVASGIKSVHLSGHPTPEPERLRFSGEGFTLLIQDSA